jgi:uncharacterized membrane protein YebE (DUF533 family)
MTSLDKHMLYYFNDELEKHAILPGASTIYKGVKSMVAKGAKGAYSGSKNLLSGAKKFNDAMIKGFGKEMGPKMSAVAGTAATAGIGYTGYEGAKKFGKTIIGNNAKLTPFKQVNAAGVQQL